jgi:LPS-assembly lipoprotein
MLISQRQRGVASADYASGAGAGRTTTAGLLLLLLVVVQALLLSACGFRLRSAAEMPAALARTHITGLNQYDSLYIKLRRALRANGIKIVDAKQATAILRIINRTRGRRVLSVSASGRVQEFEIYMLVRFEVIGKKNPLRLKNQTLTTTRDFTFNVAQVLGKSSEAELLYENMENELVQLMLYRLEAASRSRLTD